MNTYSQEPGPMRCVAIRVVENGSRETKKSITSVIRYVMWSSFSVRRVMEECVIQNPPMNAKLMT